MVKNDYYAMKASFHEWIESEIREAPISRVFLEYKAAKRYGFGHSIVTKAIDNLIAVGIAKEETKGVIESKRKTNA